MNNLAVKLQDLASALTPTIEAKRNPGVARQVLTPRRARIADSMAAEANHLERIQRSMLAVADAHIAGSVPGVLAKLKNRAQFDAVVTGRFPSDAQSPERRRLVQAGILTPDDLAQARAALEALAGPEPAKPAQEVLIAQLERGLVGSRIPGYFPTPPEVVARMLDLALLVPGEDQRVLEPSAGKGNIADALRAVGVAPDVIEIQASLREILLAKGHRIIGTDFTAFQEVPGYDRILMNPPFEKGQDIDHVRHAWSMLKPGGRIVAVMSEGVFGRSDRKSTEFRDWMQSLGGTDERNTPGAFKASERSTSVATRLVVIDR